MHEETPDAAAAVTAAVTTWIDQTEVLLGQAQTALESLRFHTGVAPDAQRTIYQLIVLLRQRRADAPTTGAVQTWLRAMSDSTRLKGPAQFLNARRPEPPQRPSPA